MSGALPLLAAAAAVMGSPGPATMSVTAVAAAFGPRRAQPWLWGIVLGTWAVLLAVGAGAMAVLLALPRLAPVLLAGGAAYMLWLAWKIGTAPPLAAPGRAAAPSFSGGMALALANPKAWLALGAVFAGHRLVGVPDGWEPALRTALLAGMVVLSNLAWLLAGSLMARWLRHPLGARIANLSFAAVLVATTVLALLG